MNCDNKCSEFPSLKACTHSWYTHDFNERRSYRTCWPPDHILPCEGPNCDCHAIHCPSNGPLRYQVCLACEGKAVAAQKETKIRERMEAHPNIRRLCRIMDGTEESSPEIKHALDRCNFTKYLIRKYQAGGLQNRGRYHEDRECAVPYLLDEGHGIIKSEFKVLAFYDRRCGRGILLANSDGDQDWCWTCATDYQLKQDNFVPTWIMK